MAHPTIEEVSAYFIEHDSTEREGMKFWNWYEAIGWKVGKKPMEKWKAAATGWILRNQDKSPAPTLRPQVDYMRHLRV